MTVMGFGKSILKRRRKRRLHGLPGLPRHEMIRRLSDAVGMHDGVVCLGKEVVVFADDIFGEVPVVVRAIRIQQGATGDLEEFDIGDGYSTIHLDNKELYKLVEAVHQ